MFWSFSDAILEPGVGFVYKWTNTVNGMMYIGYHNGHRKGYLASGVDINIAFAKFGMSNFIREILYIGSNYAQVEQEILVTIGAGISPNFYNRYNVSAEGMLGKKHSSETRALMSLQRQNENAHMHGKKHSEETKQKIRENTNNSGKNNGMYGVTRPKEWGEAHTKRMTGRKHPITVCPHCTKSGGHANMTRYHFDNCKKKGK